MYVVYLSKLIEHNEKLFFRGSYDVSITIVELLNFKWLLYQNCCLPSYVTDLDIFTEMLKGIYFAPKTDEDVKQLLFEYRQWHKFACEMAVEFRK